MNIKKLLIANRSEVALRINSTCQARGIQTVGIYTEHDAFLSFVHKVNESYLLSGQGPAAYLNPDEIIQIALRTQVDAIHPGYGFLSENAAFAQKVLDAGLIWIGPDPKTIHLAGNKTHAKNFVKKCNIPVIPGISIECSWSDALMHAQQVAASIGYPLILKDPLSGGGKAMRRITTPDTFAQAWASV
ncbi:MAG: biotin carboxylase N-terminal domain-containing protein, partial [bacterium]